MNALPMFALFLVAGQGAGQTPPRKQEPPIRVDMDNLSPSTEDPSKVRGLVLVTGDPALVKRARADGTRTYDEHRRAYPAPRFETLRWGEDRLIVVDTATGPLGKLRDNGLLLDAFLG